MGKTINHLLPHPFPSCRPSATGAASLRRGKLIYKRPDPGARRCSSPTSAPSGCGSAAPLATARDLLAARPETARVEVSDDRLKSCSPTRR